MVTQNYQCVQNHETWFTSRTHSSNCDGDVTILEHVFINLNLCCIQWYTFRVCGGKGSRDTVHKFTRVYQNHKNGLFHRLTAPHLMGMSQYFYTALQTSIFAASKGSSLMSMGGVQEIRLDKVTHVHQNHKTWLTSSADSSKSYPIM